METLIYSKIVYIIGISRMLHKKKSGGDRLRNNQASDKWFILAVLSALISIVLSLYPVSAELNYTTGEAIYGVMTDGSTTNFLNLTFQFATCSSNDCSDASWSATYENATYTSLASLDNASYFQYRASFFTENQNYTPWLFNASISYTYLDTTFPLISYGMGTEENGANKSSSWIYINLSVTEENIANITYNLYNLTSLLNSTILALQSYLNFTNLSDGTYYYNATILDYAGNANSTDTRTITLDTTLPNITLMTPLNNTYSNNTAKNLTLNITDNTALKNYTFYIYNESGIENMTSGELSGTTSTIGIVFDLLEGIKSWFALVFDWSGNLYTSQNYTLTIDTTLPQINFTAPTPPNNSGASGSFVVNLTITETNFANLSYNWNSTIINFNSSNESLTDLGSGSWIFTYTQSDLAVGQSYTYNITVTDSAGNSNATETRTVNGNVVPLFSSVLQDINATDDLDPGINITITLNITDTDSNFDTAILQWKNSTGVFGENNITMLNITEKSLSTILNATLPLPSYESNITYRIFANDTAQGSNYSSNYTIQSFWDCTWTATSSLGQVAGWDQTKHAGNLTINNTGDAQYTNASCSLDFRLTYDLTEGRVYFDSSYYKPSNVYTVAAKANTTININTTFLNEVKEDSLLITITELGGISSSSIQNTSATLVSTTGGPYLYQTIESTPSSLYLTSQNFSLEAYIRNIVGNGSDINTAHNVSFNWSLPSGFLVKDGNASQFYENINDSSLTHNYLNISLNSTNLPSLSPGTYNITLYAQGYNSSGSLIEHAGNQTILTQSAIILLSCYNISDGIYVTACGSLDGDYVAPQASSSSSSSSGGGGGGGSPAEINIENIESSAAFEFVRGDKQSFNLEIENTHKVPLNNITLKVSGINSEYIEIYPKSISHLAPLSSVNVSIRISAPAYFNQGNYTLIFDIEGILFVNNLTTTVIKEKKITTLHILEFSKKEAEAMLEDSREIIKSLLVNNITSKELDRQLENAEKAYNKLDFISLKKSYDLINSIKSKSLESMRIISELKAGIEKSERNGISVIETKQILYLAEIAFSRGDFDLSLERLKEARLTYALQVKGEFNLISTIKNNPVPTASTLLAAVFLSLSSAILIRLQLYKKKLRFLQEEEKLLLELMKVVQRECFEKSRMSMEEYDEAMSQYELKLSKTIEERINVESKIANILKVKGKKKALHMEKERLVSLIKKVQDDYLNKGRLETRIYEKMIRSYSMRLTEIEENLTLIDMEETLQSGKFIHKILRQLRLKK